jgi:aspartyl-tRNA(Asn)/glutamyl-tRNA(Gln) amidotransferase subunit B
MEIDYFKYEAVIGLEVHAQMLTHSKAFSSDATVYGAAPNTLLSPLTLGHPGTLPKHNIDAVRFAIKMGLACKSEIASHNYYARKNYFYADLPKGYQITQHTTPICEHGFISIKLKSGVEKQIGLTRIHMEEDTGKSMHDQDVYDTLIDYNRAGTPLIEIVSEPDMRTGEEAYQYLTEIRKLLRYLDICDGNMEEGSMRCDANVSVRLKGAPNFGTKVEVKNMNSIRNVQRAIDFEIKRQIEALESGIVIVQETRTYDALKDTTIVMRTKEGASDYRYFPEPDLPPLAISYEFIDSVKKQMPTLPQDLMLKYTKEYGLSEYDAGVLTESKHIASYFESVLKHTKAIKLAANWVMVQVKGYLNELALDIQDFTLKPEVLAEIIELIESNKISHTAASQKLFPALLANPQADISTLAAELNIMQVNNTADINLWVEAALAKYPEKVKEYKAGKHSLVGLFMGEVMKLSKGKADPKIANTVLKELLDR